MPINSTKILFLMTLISGILISLCANSWLGAWMGLEINLLSFLPLLTSNKNMFSTEASLKYFLVQAIASATLLFTILLKTNTHGCFFSNSNSWNNIIILPLLMKIASAPFHWWLPSVVEGLSWMNCFIILSIQKIAPLILISYLLMNNILIQLIIMTSAFIGGIGGFNQTSIRKILAYSSINHISWMLTTMILGSNLWMMYLIVYMLNITMIISLTSIINLSYITQTFNLIHNQKSLKLSLFIMMLSLGGLPPFLGFFPKWITIQFMTQNSMIITAMILILSSLLTLYYYMRIMYPTLMISNSEEMWMTQVYPKNQYPILLMMTLATTTLGILVCSLAISIY